MPVFPDDEGGIVEQFYQEERRTLYRAHERGRREHSQPGFGPYVHSHIKLVQARVSVRDERQ